MSSQNAGCFFLHVIQALGEHHPVRTRFRHDTFSSSASVDLGFHHEPLRARFFRQGHSRLVSRFRGVCHFASLDGDAEGLKDALALVFVDVHAKWVV